MIQSLKLKNYRGFQDFRLSALSRVNLLVGKNNSGKTSILEAINLLASGCDPRVLSRIARQRGEIFFDAEDRDREAGCRLATYADISHFFHDHVFELGGHFTIKTDDGMGELTARVINMADAAAEAQQYLFEEMGPLRAAFAIRVETDKNPQGRFVFPVSEEGAISVDQIYRFGRSSKSLRPDDSSVVLFITQDSLERSPMSEMWDKVITDGRERDVVKAMKILEPRLNNVFFLTSERTIRFENRGGILVAFEGTSKRNSLGSYGEGMRRLLALSLSLAWTRGGILLIDEIDTGLHYSIMGEMWLLVVEAAKQYNIQVFATTHSYDCIKGLAWLCENHPQLKGEVSLQKIDRNLNEAVGLDGEQIRIAQAEDIEVR
jgi:predicted ATPase